MLPSDSILTCYQQERDQSGSVGGRLQKGAAELGENHLESFYHCLKLNMNCRNHFTLGPPLP